MLNMGQKYFVKNGQIISFACFPVLVGVLTIQANTAQVTAFGFWHVIISQDYKPKRDFQIYEKIFF